MFVKKIVEKASFKKPGSCFAGLKSEDVSPHLVFHQGVPSGSTQLAYDPVQRIVAVSTKDGRIKLFGKDNTQALLESSEIVPSKFLQFLENQGILLDINFNNHIQVWDIDKKLSYVHPFKVEIASFVAIQHTHFMFIGDSIGNIAVLKLEKEPCSIVQMKYHIPLSASHVNSTEVDGDTAVVHILPQPAAESKRILIIYRDGCLTLWSVQESKAIFVTGGTMLQSLCHEKKKATAACWACPFGSKVAVGYSNGEIFIWSIPSAPNSKTDIESEKELYTTSNAPICKLNLGYKLEKIPIATLKWVYADGKANRLYVLGESDTVSANVLQVIILNENTETRMIKLGLHPPEPCVDLEIVSSFTEQSKHKQDLLLLLGKSGHLYAYDDVSIEKHLVQSQSRPQSSLPEVLKLKLPCFGSIITVAKFITDNSCLLHSEDEDYNLLSNRVPSLFPSEQRAKDGTNFNTIQFRGFSYIKNLYVTGHGNGAINFWDLSTPLVLPILSLTQQSQDNFSLSGIPLTALYFDINSRLLVSGDQIGVVRIFKFKPEPFNIESSFVAFQGSTRKGSSYYIDSVKLVMVNGAILSINPDPTLKYLAVGSEKGYVSVIDMMGPNLLYQTHVASELCADIVSSQFSACNFHGFEKNTLVLATKDSSVLVLDRDTGNSISSSVVRPKKPSRALFMQILDGQVLSDRVSDGLDTTKGNSVTDGTSKQLLLLCSEKAACVYSLIHAVQGVKRVYYKKKFHSSSCCWASTFCGPSSVGLLLLFSSGKMEIRSLPELSLLKDISLNGLTFLTPKSNLPSHTSICSSCNGDIIMVNGDQEMFAISVLLKETYRNLDSVSQIYKEKVIPQGVISHPVIHKEKKKGIFSSFVKDSKGSQSKAPPFTEAEDAKEIVEELSRIFSVANFPLEAERNEENPSMDENEIQLDIDDINLDDLDAKPRGNPVMSTLNKEKLASTFQAFKGKLKQMKIKNETNSAKEEPQDEKVVAVNQIKKKYGVVSSDGSSVANITKGKLNENVKKLQGISVKTTQMQDTAQSFSSMAKDVLRFIERDRPGS